MHLSKVTRFKDLNALSMERLTASNRQHTCTLEDLDEDYEVSQRVAMSCKYKFIAFSSNYSHIFF